MDTVRSLFALLIFVSVPSALLVWLMIHPFVAFWRRRGPAVTYVIVVTCAFLVAWGLFQFRDAALRFEYGFSWPLTIVGIFVYLVAVVIEVQCRRHLTTATLVGLPEISTKRESRLLTEGIYARVRHPRYLGVLVGTWGFALVINYLVTYVVAIGVFPLLYLVVLLEERELRDRFGEEYVRYMERVPRFMPRIG